MQKKKPLAASYGVGRGGIVFIRGGGPQAYIPAGNQFSVSVSGLCCESVSVSVSVSMSVSVSVLSVAWNRLQECAVQSGRLQKMFMFCDSVGMQMMAFVVNGCTAVPPRC